MGWSPRPPDTVPSVSRSMSSMGSQGVMASLSILDETRRVSVSKKGHEIFLDPDAMKDRIRRNAIKKDYDVRNFYHETGCAQRVARHDVFERITFLVITVNVMWIAYDTEYNGEPTLLTADAPFVIMENFFCLYFTVEWALRFLSFKYKRHCLQDAWCVFDGILVLFMVAETWAVTLVAAAMGAGSSSGLGDAAVVRLARILRVSRMARLARLLKVVPELLILLKGITAAARPVTFTLMLLGGLTYLFSIVFRQITDGTDVGLQFFPTVIDSMHTLLRDGTLLDGIGSVVAALHEESVFLVLAFYVFVLLASLTVMNMLIGVLCEVVSAVAATEKEQLMVQSVKMQLEKILKQVDIDPSWDGPIIAKEHLTRMLELPRCCRSFMEMGVDAMVLVDNIDYIFSTEPTDEDDEPPEKMLTVGEFMNLILDLRGTNTATVRDIVNLRKYVHFCSDELMQEEMKRREMTSSSPFVATMSRMDSERRLEGPQSPSALSDRGSIGQEGPEWKPMPEREAEAQSLPELRSSLVRALLDVQSETMRLVDTLPAEAMAAASSISDVNAWEEVVDDDSQKSLAECGSDKLLLWTAEDVDSLRDALGHLVQQTSSSLTELQRLRFSGRASSPQAEKPRANCLSCL
mmetsp:Transcript_27735/g.62439  ORF Transcript_27735/g.62439 Transcript_27735/m.62439 type:complete len:634 (+) Transcript_27735:3-1904(+)